jgi:Protein of unknown function (DUF732)
VLAAVVLAAVAVGLGGCYSGSAEERFFKALNGADLSTEQRNELLSLGEDACTDVRGGADPAEAARRTAERVADTPDLEVSDLGAAQLASAAVRYLCPDAG